MALMILRQLLSIAILPFTVTVLIPAWIARGDEIAFTTPDGPMGIIAIAAGCLVGAGGLALFAWSLCLFWTRGRGTLAPWDPPRQFVIDGPYRHVRNPMMSGVIAVLVAEAMVCRSKSLAEWAALFLVINLVYIPLTEEPLLEARFGDAYRMYKRNVRMFIPRMRPWRQ